MSLHYKNQRGFTLAELLIYLVVLSGATLLIASTFVSLNRGQGLAESQAEVNSNTRFAIEKITQDLKNATAVTTPQVAGTSSPTLLMTVSGSSVLYCEYADTLMRETLEPSCTAGSSPVTGTNVKIDSMSFTRYENTNTVLNKTVISIKVSITISHVNSSPERRFTQTKETTVYLP